MHIIKLSVIGKIVFATRYGRMNTVVVFRE